MADYGSQLVRWMQQNSIENGAMKSYFMSGAPDKAKEAFADMYLALHQEKQKPHDPEDELVHLEPYKGQNGSFGYIDRRKGHVVVSVDRNPNGSFDFFGPRKYITMLFGRGELSVLADRTADGDYWNKT